MTGERPHQPVAAGGPLCSPPLNRSVSRAHASSVPSSSFARAAADLSPTPMRTSRSILMAVGLLTVAACAPAPNIFTPVLK